MNPLNPSQGFLCSRARSLINASSLIVSCDTVGNGVLRLETTFEYPWHEAVDLFVEPVSGDPDAVVISDGGFTITTLLGFGLDPDSTSARRCVVKAVCDQLKVRRVGAEFQIVVAVPDDRSFGPSAVRLGQACTRIADLILHYKHREP